MDRNETCADTLAEMFGSNVFNDTVMRARLPKGVYRKLRETIDERARQGQCRSWRTFNGNVRAGKMLDVSCRCATVAP